MQRMGLVQGTRAEIIAELDRLGADAARVGKADKATTFAQALASIEEGDSAVVVHHVMYWIIEDEGE